MRGTPGGESCPDVQNATPKSGVQLPAPVTGLPEQVGDGLFHRTVYGLSRPAYPFLRVALGKCSCRVPAVLGRLYGSGCRNITGAL